MQRNPVSSEPENTAPVPLPGLLQEGTTSHSVQAQLPIIFELQTSDQAGVRNTDRALRFSLRSLQLL